MAGPRTDNTGRIQGKGNNEQQGQNLGAFLMSPAMKAQIGLALPKHINPDRMMRITLTALRSTPNLAKCDQTTFMGCVLQASQLGLECNTALGHAYLIPRRDKQTGNHYCTLIVGYQGMIELALRSGKVSGIKTLVVRSGDHFEYEDGLDPRLVYRPSGDHDRETKPITHVVGIARIKGADPIFEVLSRAQIDARMKRSESVNSSYSPWKTDYEAMARKTAVRALFKWIPKSPEMAAAAHLEETHERGERQAFDAEVAGAIDTMGYEVAAQGGGEDLPVPEGEPYDQATGETINSSSATPS